MYLYPSAGFGHSSRKCSKPACDLNAIGHRRLFKAGVNWYSYEKEMGEKLSVALEHQAEIVKDDQVTAYLTRMAQHIAENSDADTPVTVHILRLTGVTTFTLPGGHVYLTTRLLLQLQTEADLATILARDVAHVALHSFAREQARASLLAMSDVALAQVRPDANSLSTPGMVAGFEDLKFQREDERAADYFGVQYFYKAGYDPECFLKAIRRLWQPAPAKPQLAALSPFPPLTERLKTLQKEIDDFLPKRPAAVVSTPQFDQFIQRLQQIDPPQDASQPDAPPKLIRHDAAADQ